MITASMSTIAWREPGLALAVASVLPQVDRLNAFLQGYDHVPACLAHPKIVVVRDYEAPESADKGASAKFHWHWHGLLADGYHVVVDDDIAYPPGYVRMCIDKIDEYGGAPVVGFHGGIYKPKMVRYFRDRQVWPFDRQCESDRFVHMLGTGTTAYRTSAIRLTPDDFAEPNSCDLFLGIAAQRQKVPMLCMARLAGYLRPLPLASDPRACAGPEEYALRMVRIHASISGWEIHTAPVVTDQPAPVVVVVPCYNEPIERIERTVASALATPGVDLVRVVDDGSTVPVELATRERVEVMRCPTNAGPSAALNAGIRSLPTRAIICRLDVGDAFRPEAKARQIAMVKAGAPAVCAWRHDPVTGKDVKIRDGWQRDIFSGCQFSSTASVFTRAAWLECGGFDSSIRWCDDWRFSAAMQAHVGWTAMHEVTGEHGTFPGGHSDVGGDPKRRDLRQIDRSRVATMVRALGSPEKHAHLFSADWCAKRGLVPMKKPRPR